MRGPAAEAGPVRVAVAGNPNVGKTSLFNRLTGLRYRVGNYPGITVEVRDGRMRADLGSSVPVELLDLPGTYSLTPLSEEEAVAFRALEGDDDPPPDGVLIVADATNLARNLYLTLQILEMGVPAVLALNMADAARDAGLDLDPEALGAVLGVPVIATSAATGEGLEAIARALGELRGQAPSHAATLVEGERWREAERRLLEVAGPRRARWLITAVLPGMAAEAGVSAQERSALDALGVEARVEAARSLIIARYARVDELVQIALRGRPGDEEPRAVGVDRSAEIDRVVTHRFLGPLLFILVMGLVFQSIFSWATPFADLIEAGLGWLGERAASALGPGMFTDLLVEGVIGGVGNVVVFVPQIALLFLFVGLLEESGYMARAAFIIDRLMSRVGLNGKAFVPLLSGYACAIPAIMSTRTIASFKDRLVTILMIPFMSCSARLPIYALLIAAFFDEDRHLWGPFTLGGVILLAMYLLSTVSALGMGAIYKRTLLRSPTPPLVLELPPYRLPQLRNVLAMAWDRTSDFLRDAGTVILAFTIVLWGLLTFPQVDPNTLPEGETPIQHSVAGRMGKAIEPALEPIGQDWRVGIGIIGSFAAREVLVSTMGLVYGIESDVDEDDAPLREELATAVDAETGERRYSPLSAVALMVFFVYACQCMSTLAVVKRETNSWKWPVIMFFSMTLIAYVMALIVYQGGLLLGFG